MIKYQLLEPLQFPLVNKFYKAQNTNRKANRTDRVFVAKKDNQIVASVIYKPIDQYSFLTGVHVSDDFRGQGVGSELVRFSLSLIPEPVITFPYDSLLNWYQHLGFKDLSADALSEQLKGRFDAYKKQGRDIVVMKKHPESL